jgi:hypothetical protein
MKQEFGIREKSLIVAIFVVFIFAMWFSFSYIPQKGRNSIEKMKIVEPVIKCGIDCNSKFGSGNEKFNKCLKECSSQKDNDSYENKWILIDHETFWNNPDKFSSTEYKFPDISFSYPEEWIFSCCHDSDANSKHLIYPFLENNFEKKFEELEKFHIEITHHGLHDCKKPAERCALGSMVAYSSNDKFNILKNRLEEKLESSNKIQLSNFSQVIVFDIKENKKNYLINTGDGVVEIVFIGVNKFKDGFIEYFINKLK